MFPRTDFPSVVISGSFVSTFGIGMTDVNRMPFDDMIFTQKTLSHVGVDKGDESEASKRIRIVNIGDLAERREVGFQVFGRDGIGDTGHEYSAGSFFLSHFGLLSLRNININFVFMFKNSNTPVNLVF